MMGEANPSLSKGFHAHRLISTETGPLWIFKSLDFNQITVGIPEETVIDPEIRIMTGTFFKSHPFGYKIIIPPVDIICDQGDDDAFSRWWIRIPAEAQISVLGYAVNPAATLIKNEGQTKHFLVKLDGFLKSARVAESDQVIERDRHFHRKN